jgi:hypothetical protein
MATRRRPRTRPRGKPAREPRTSADEALAEELLRVSQKEQAGLVAGWEKFLKQLAIRGRPIGAKELREKLLKRGFDPQTNEFSKGIIAMREE